MADGTSVWSDPYSKVRAVYTMGTLNAIYVRATQGAKDAGFLESSPTAVTEPGLEFFVIEQPRTTFFPPEAELARGSARWNTDVLWLTFQSTPAAFRFHHWAGGRQVRWLVYGYDKQGMWERVEGEPEPWEREAFFDPDALTALLENASRTEATALKRFWHEAKVAAGRTFPTISAREAARSLAAYYGLPGWS
jgi:hypothetical protein